MVIVALWTLEKTENNGPTGNDRNNVILIISRLFTYCIGGVSVAMSY